MTKGLKTLKALNVVYRAAQVAIDQPNSRFLEGSQVLPLIKKLRPIDPGIELIRIGGSHDGGYLIPDDLEGIEYCFSPGVGPFSEFESQLADRGIRSFLADASVDGPSIGRPEFIFDKKFLGASDRGDYITLGTWKDKYLKGYTGDLMLQMDIEGFEYEVIFNLPDSLLQQFRIMVIEFHGIYKLFERFLFPIYSSCFEKLLEYFHVVHIHPNNGHPKMVKLGELEIPDMLEFTFLNKKRVRQYTTRADFPHKLDADDAIGKSIVLPRCWYE
jgi:hypothetical protein